MALIPESDIEAALLSEVQAALEKQQPLRIVGGDSKAFYGEEVQGKAIDVSRHSGVIDYDPAELVITLRAGSPLKEVERLLAQNQQMLAFEPPLYTDESTVGGMVASGLAGPRRAYAGSVRDHLLGVKIIDGRGDILNFGGRVIKNVAGFDISRSMVGACGTLGLILEVSLRVVPMAMAEVTLAFEHDAANDHTHWVNTLASKPFLFQRRCGTQAGVIFVYPEVKQELLKPGNSWAVKERSLTGPALLYKGTLFLKKVKLLHGSRCRPHRHTLMLIQPA